MKFFFWCINYIAHHQVCIWRTLFYIVSTIVGTGLLTAYFYHQGFMG